MVVCKTMVSFVLASTTTHGEGRVGDKSDEGQFQKLQTATDNKGSPTISQFIIETSS